MRRIEGSLLRYCVFAFLFFFPWCASRADSTFQFDTGGAHVEVVVNASFKQLSDADVKRWVHDAADSVTTYYGHFPVSHLVLKISSFDGTGVRNGRTFAKDGGLIMIRIGAETTARELSSDWMMTHEMVHLAFPNVADEHHWIEEGLATYVEPIARIQAGHLDAASMWSDLVRDLPKGLPAAGDQGLDHTHTWGRTYWGGALFCFLAEIQIRKETKNQKGLQDALRGILDAGGNMEHDWELEDAFRAGDRATGTHVLLDLYKEMRDKAVETNLDPIWKQLGVKLENDVVHFQDDAELAAIRQAITATNPAPKR
jgi:hypothetical protein